MAKADDTDRQFFEDWMEYWKEKFLQANTPVDEQERIMELASSPAFRGSFHAFWARGYRRGMDWTSKLYRKN